MFKSLMLKAMFLLAGVALAILQPLGASSLRAQSPDAIAIRVEVTDDGFACAPKTANCLGVQEGLFTIAVEQGRLVELTIVWAHKNYVREEHIIVLEGYKLETDLLTPANRQAIFKFIADKPGTFGFKCDLECDIHDQLQRGVIKVTRAGGGSSAAALTTTTLTLAPAPSIAASGEIVRLTAVLKDSRGVPVPKAEVRFFTDSEFVGTKDKMEIGVKKTDANGIATLEYQSTLNLEQQKITARFEGMGIYAESEQTANIQVVGEPLAAYTVMPLGSENVALWAGLSFILVLLAVWTTYSFVAYQVFRIFREPS